LTRRLEDNGFHAGALTGDLHQRVRLRVLREFKTGTLPILVATDVASRGLHIEGVTHVINYDVPQDPEDYVHRIGRTARAGASGKALTLACETYVMALESIEGLIGFRLPVVHVEDEMLAKPVPPAHGHRPHRPRPHGRDGQPMPPGRRRRGRRRGAAAAAGTWCSERANGSYATRASASSCRMTAATKSSFTARVWHQKSTSRICARVRRSNFRCGRARRAHRHST